jgi:prephenate dehydrogenase
MNLERMRVSVAGLGLVGGSIARALRRSGVEKIYGIDIDADVLLLAEADGTIDAGFEEGAVPLGDSDLVFLCLHPDALVSFISANADRFKPGALLTDTAGVRRGINDRVTPLLRPGIRFVGGHPMAGKEDQGYRASDPDIFRGASYILTPRAGCPREDVEEVASLARALGCDTVKETDEATHDRMIAYTSHLPHLAAAAMVRNPLVSSVRGFCGGSFRDATRVARINPGLWAELLASNADEVLPALDKFIEELSLLRGSLRAGDRDSLRRLLAEARRMNDSKPGQR